MICFPADANEVEISAISDYWLLSDESESTARFVYLVKEVDAYYKPEKEFKRVRPVNALASRSGFVTDHPAFTCKICNKKRPAKNRNDYENRIKAKWDRECSECFKNQEQRIANEAHQTLQKFMAEAFQPKPSLDSLTIVESLALLSLLPGLDQGANRRFLGESFEEISITGVRTIDHGLYQSLLSKRALIHVSELPADVEHANTVICGESSRITYDNRYPKQARYRHPDSVTPGVYLNHPGLDDSVEASDIDISSLLFRKLSSTAFLVGDVARIHQIVREMQAVKLYQLVREVIREFRIEVEPSGVLRALLDHLAENYSPQKLFFTFRVKAQEAIVYKQKEAVPEYVARHLFAKFLGNYINFIEDRGFELKRVRALPPNIQTSHFEALFSQLYLNQHFDWNKLSAKEVVALGLENIRLSDSTQELLFESGEQK